MRYDIIADKTTRVKKQTGKGNGDSASGWVHDDGIVGAKRGWEGLDEVSADDEGFDHVPEQRHHAENGEGNTYKSDL